MTDTRAPFTKPEISEDDRERMQFAVSEMVNKAEIPFLSVRQVYKILDAVFEVKGGRHER